MLKQIVLLEAENLLLDTNLDIKIADFGFSNQYDPDGKLDTFCGSPPYAAPELFQGRRYVGPEVDIWSLGVILYVLTTGCLPFDGKNLQEMRESVCRGKYRIPFYLSESCEKLLRKFLIKDPTKRASLDIIVDDAWLNDGYTEPPICMDLSMKISEDENLIKLLEQKFHIGRDVILKSLRENLYDDVSALYYLMYHERDRTGDYSRVNQVLNDMTVPPAALTSTRESSSTLPRISQEKGSHIVTSPTETDSTSSSAGGSPLKNVLHMEPTSNTAVSSTRPSLPTQRASSTAPRRRRFTMGTDQEKGSNSSQDHHEVTPDKPNPTSVMTPESSSFPSRVTAKFDVSTAPRPTTCNTPTPTGGAPSPLVTNLVAPMSATPSSLNPNTHTSNLASPPSSTFPGDDADGIRKRNNTIVGILRNTISRSKAPEPASESTLPSPMASPAEEGKPRSLRFTFNSNTTSSKPPDEMVQLVLDGCVKNHIQHKLVSRYLIECIYTVPHDKDTIHFEVEICKLPRLKNLHGLRFKRMVGSSNDYKQICEKLLQSIAL
ncbi:MAP/microtubule affinity-regulating kinase 3 [Coelomomyces lativittatus]|nr:MAP/microtubule affinity-regulating kinase 3 [Coelomomyces lativittatus]